MRRKMIRNVFQDNTTPATHIIFILELEISACSRLTAKRPVRLAVVEIAQFRQWLNLLLEIVFVEIWRQLSDDDFVLKDFRLL